MAIQVQSQECLSFGDYELDCRTGELRRNGTTLRLQPQPAKILVILATRSGQVVSRQELVDQVWGTDTHVDFEHGLNFAVRQIRSVLEDDSENPRFLETVPKRGYRFIARINEPVQSQAAVPDTPAARHLPRLLLMISVGVIVVSVAILAIMRVWPRKKAVNQKIDSIAVLPLHNLSNDPEQEYFSEGMTDQLITDLARVGGLRVISHTSVERYRDTKRALPDIAKELGVAAVVEGSVMRSGDRVRITAQLIDARTDQHVWADSYERDFRDVLALQDELSGRIANEIGSTLGGGEKAGRTKRAVDPAAYEAYLKATSYSDHISCSSLKQSLDYFQEAVAKDPNFAPAQSGLANTYYYIADSTCWQAKTYPEAEAAASRAIALDPENADAHAVLAKIAFSRDWNWTKASQEFRTAVQLDPNDAAIHSAYGIYLMAMGKQDEALVEANKAQELDPVSEQTNFWHTVILYMAHHYDEAIDQAKNAVSFYPSYGEYYWLGECYEKKDMPDEAIEYYLRALAGWPDEIPLFRAAYRKNGLAGFWEEEERVGRRKNMRVGPVRRAEFYVHRGMKEQAIQQLQLAYKQHAGGMELIKAQPIFDGLRDDPRFKDLLVRLQLR